VSVCIVVDRGFRKLIVARPSICVGFDCRARRWLAATMFSLDGNPATAALDLHP
jgi:hypothetical protein